MYRARHWVAEGVVSTVLWFVVFGGCVLALWALDNDRRAARETARAARPRR
jgi:hypothetical protein